MRNSIPRIDDATPKHEHTGHVLGGGDHTVGVRAELGDQVLGRQIEPEVSQPPRERVDQRRCAHHELLEAAHHGRNDQRGKQHHREEQDHEDQAGGHPALPPALREPVDRRLEREGQEQRHPDRGQETRELSEQPEHRDHRQRGPDQNEVEPAAAHLDRVGYPGGHRHVPGRTGVAHPARLPRSPARLTHLGEATERSPQPSTRSCRRSAGRPRRSSRSRWSSSPISSRGS